MSARQRRLPEALKILGFEDSAAPCHATYHYAFRSLDAEALSRVLGAFALGGHKPDHIAIDGKTLKGSRRHDAAVVTANPSASSVENCWSVSLSSERRVWVGSRRSSS